MNAVLDKRSPVPIYMQIAEELKRRIEHGGFEAGAAIPSERNLTEQFGVSRMTVRQAITDLVNAGLLYRERGSGTFVAAPKVEQPLSGLTSFTEDMKSRGLLPGSKILRFEKQQPEPDIQTALQLDAGDEVFFVERIRCADNQPMAIERNYLPVKLFPEFTKESLAGSLYALIEQDWQFSIGRASQHMGAALVNVEDAELLQITVPAAVLIIERISCLTNGVPFEVVRSTYRADRYKFISDIYRN